MKTIITNYLVLAAIMFSAIVTVHFIPRQWIESNVQASVITFRKETLYPNILNFKLFQLDNYTDAMMLNFAISADSSRPIISAMLNNGQTSSDYYGVAEDVNNIVYNRYDGMKTLPYGRYWHGYQIILRPLLCIFNYQQIRLLNYLLFSALILSITWLMVKKVGINILILFLISIMFISFPIVPLNMTLSTDFYISFFAIILILCKRESILGERAFASLFFVIGGLTSYFDLLTVPLVTLGLPLLVYIVYVNPVQKNRTVLAGSGLWFLGFASIWSTKWVVGTLITGVNLIQDALDEASLRMSKRIFTGMEVTIPNILEFIYTYLQQYHLFWPLVSLSLIILAFLVGAVKNWRCAKDNSYLLLVSLMVPAWYLVLRNHSIQHGWLTWRAMVVSVFAGLLFISQTMSLERYRRLFKTS